MIKLSIYLALFDCLLANSNGTKSSESTTVTDLLADQYSPISDTDFWSLDSGSVADLASLEGGSDMDLCFSVIVVSRFMQKYASYLN